jgi:hypothetical protein
MKNLRGIIVTFLVVFFIMGVSVAFGDPLPSAGYPSVSVLGDPEIQVGVLSKYEASTFTPAEAEAISGQVATILSELLGSMGLDTSVSLMLNLTPSQVAANFGFTSADAFAAFALDNYKAYGLDLYVFLDVSRVAGLNESGLPGDNIRIDAWIGDISNILPGLVPGDYLYVTSVEVPEIYLTLSSSLL